MDRFSQPLSREFSRSPFQEQQPNHKELIQEYLFQYADTYGILPETEEVQEHFEPREIEYDLIEKAKEDVKQVIKWV